MNAAADAALRLEHEHAQAHAFERCGGMQAGEPRADDDDVEIRIAQRAASDSSEGSSTPQSDGFAGPGRPDKQQSGAQRSWLGPSEPSARRGAFGAMRSTMSSRTISMYFGCVPTVP